MNHRTRALLISPCALILMASSAPAQFFFERTAPGGYRTLEGNAGTSDPMSSGVSQRWQWVYDSSNFNVPGPMVIQRVRIRADGGQALPAFTQTNVEITIASATGNYDALSSANLDSNLGSNKRKWVLPAYSFNNPGAAGSTCGPSPWVDLIPGLFHVYDPTLGQDLVIEIKFCGTSPIWAVNADAVTGAMARRYGNSTSCSSNVADTTDDLVPVLELDFGGSFQWQTNRPQASLTVDGRQNDPLSPVRIQSCQGASHVLAGTSTLTGNPWDLAYAAAPGTAADQNGFRTQNGQIINMDLSKPVFFLNGFNFGSTSFQNFSFLINAYLPITISGQMVVIDATHPDGARLSALCEAVYMGPTVALPSPVAGPTGDDTSVTVNVGCIAFYGTVYSEIHVGSNGRITFGTPDTTPAPSGMASVCQSPPFAGYWADLDVSAGGSITVSSVTYPFPLGNAIRVDYVNVPYAGENPSITNTFGIELDGIRGLVTIDGLGGIAPHPAAMPDPGDNGLLGISPGAGAVTLPPTTGFAIGGPVFTPNPTQATFALGLAGTLAPGVSIITFTPQPNGSGAGNYYWTAQ